jgi:hypothetical protein
MKRKAARDYEDLLQVRTSALSLTSWRDLRSLHQCAIPAFEMLLPEPHNSIIMKLLYIYAQWHAIAKLRMQHDATLQLLDYTTTWLGAQTRLFVHETCARVATKELKKESEARERHDGSGNGKGPSTRKAVKFNIFTIKFHFLGDYIPAIQQFGTTDSFSTETVGSFMY